MNKNEIYKSIGVIESAIMCAKETIGFVNTDYVMEHLTAVQDWVDKSVIPVNNINLTSPFFTDKDNPFELCKVTKGLHYYNGNKCDYCGKVKDE